MNPISCSDHARSISFPALAFGGYPQCTADRPYESTGQRRAEQLDCAGTPKTIMLTQVILTQLGIQPPELDGWTYFDKREK